MKNLKSPLLTKSIDFSTDKVHILDSHSVLCMYTNTQTNMLALCFNNHIFDMVIIITMFVHTSAMTDPHRLPLWYLVYLFILCFHVSFLFAISPSPSLIRISHPFVTASQGPPHLVLFYYFFTFCLLIKLLFACTYVDSFVLFAPVCQISPIFTFPLRLKHPFMHFFRTTLFNDR